MDQEHMDAFLADLLIVCERHQISISGCGCCMSPWACDESAKAGEWFVKADLVDGLGENLRVDRA